MWKNIEIGFYLMFIGVGVVFLSLFILMQFIKVIGWLERGMKHLINRSKPIIATTAHNGIHKKDTEIPPEEIAVIAAAVYTVLQKKAHIHHIRMLPPDSQETWSQVGRWDLLHSHDLRK